MFEPSIVVVIDDDDAVREALCMSISTLKLQVFGYSSAREFLAMQPPGNVDCIVLDVRMPWMSGLDLQRRLNEKGDCPPIIFISGHGDIPMAVEAIHKGAVDFLQKPFQEQRLLDRVQQALDMQRQKRQRHNEQATIHARLACLTRREKDILNLIMQGQRTKDIADTLGISIKTVEGHRAHLLRRMHVSTTTELVKTITALHSRESAHLP